MRKALDLLNYIKEYTANGYRIEESQAVINALGVLGAYVEFHKKGVFSQKR